MSDTPKSFYQLKLIAWGFPKIPTAIFEMLEGFSYAKFGSTDPFGNNNPFVLDFATTQADVDAAFRELESLRKSEKPDFAKWLWLECSQLGAVEMATCLCSTEEEIINAIDSFVTPLSDTQKDLALQWDIETQVEIDNLEPLDLPVEYSEKLTENVKRSLREKQDNESRTHLRVAAEVDKLLKDISLRKSK